jgi:hypothetical protein
MKPEEAAAQELAAITAALHSKETVQVSTVGTFVGPTRWASNQHTTLAFTGPRILLAGVERRSVLAIRLSQVTGLSFRKTLLSNTLRLAYDLPGIGPSLDEFFFGKKDRTAVAFVDAVRERMSSRRPRG